MALTNTVRAFEARNFMAFVDATFDTSYAAGGEVFDPELVLTQFPVGLEYHIEAPPSGGYLFEYDYVNKKLKVLVEGDAAGPLVEVAGTTDLHTLTAKLRIQGI